MKLLKFLLLPIVIALISILSGGRKNTRENSKDKHGGNQKNGSANVTHPPTHRIKNAASPIEVLIVQPKPEDEQNWRKEQKEFWKRQLRVARRLNKITFFAGLVALGGLWILKIQADATRDATDAAKDAAYIARRTFDENVKTFQQDQRAWVGIKTLRFFPLELNKPTSIEVLAVNTGKTPAHNVINHATIVIHPVRLSIKELMKFKKTPKTPGSNTPMVPNFDFAIIATTTEALSDEEIKAIRAGKLFAYVFGEIKYLDVFGKSHQTTFCGYYLPASDRFGLCAEYNNAN